MVFESWQYHREHAGSGWGYLYGARTGREQKRGGDFDRETLVKTLAVCSKIPLGVQCLEEQTRECTIIGQTSSGQEVISDLVTVITFKS